MSNLGRGKVEEPADDDRPYDVLPDESTPQQRQAVWDVGAGLQRIDGLEPTPVAYKLMAEQVAGRVGYEQVVAELDRYHAASPSRDPRSHEADVAAVRIAQIVAEPGFTLSPGALAAVHGRIFDGLLPDRRWEGRFRTENISKAEPVLGGRSVAYTSAAEIVATLRWEFDQENTDGFVPKDDADAVAHVLRFTSSIWQVHPFREGNTRAIAAYAIKHLRSLGVTTDNTPFAVSSPYFRDALVLANATDPRQRDKAPLATFGRMLLGAHVDLPDLRAMYPRN